MKNKKFTLGLTLLVAGSLFLTNCTKNKTNEAPALDNNTASTQEVTKIQMIVNDIMEIAAQGGNGATGLQPFLSDPTTTNSIMQGTNTIMNTPAILDVQLIPKYYTVTFNQTIGRDGRVRNGVLTFNYLATTNSLVPQIFHRTPAFDCMVTGLGYAVDDYSVSITSMRIFNKTIVGFPTVPNTPTNTIIKWDVNADVTISRAVGSTTEISSFNGTINQTLLNTNNTPVPMPIASPQTFTIYLSPPLYATLKWENAYCSYSGNGTGTLANGDGYTLSMSNLTRNNNNSPQKFYANPSGLMIVPERHPFVSGLMTFKPGSKPTREIDFGVGEVVDYNAKVTIEGITYDVDCN